jgi:modification methylase
MSAVRLSTTALRRSLKRSEWLDTILKGDCVAALDRLPEKSVDVIFADPPYNLQLDGDLHRPDQSKVDAVDDDWDQFESFEAYDAFTRAWLLAARRVLKPNGTIWVIGSYHNIFRVGARCRISASGSSTTCLAQDQPDAELPRPPLPERARDDDLGLARPEGQGLHLQLRRHEGGQRRRADALRLAVPDLHRRRALKDDDGDKVHPTQKPEALLARVMLASTKPGDVVLDPFFGSGTTGAVAKRLGRISSASSASRPISTRPRARIAAVEPLASAELP